MYNSKDPVHFCLVSGQVWRVQHHPQILLLISVCRGCCTSIIPGRKKTKTEGAHAKPFVSNNPAAVSKFRSSRLSARILWHLWSLGYDEGHPRTRVRHLWQRGGLASLARCKKSPYVYTELPIHPRDASLPSTRAFQVAPSPPQRRAERLSCDAWLPTNDPPTRLVGFRSAKDPRLVTNTTKRSSHQIQANWLARSKAMFQNLLT